MSEPKTLYRLCEEWRAKADSLAQEPEFDGGVSFQAEQSAAELEAALRAWDAELDEDDGTTHLMTETVRKRVLGIKP